MNVKTKFHSPDFSKNQHFSRLPEQLGGRPKIREFWRGTNPPNPLIIGHLGTKKALTKNAILGNSS